MGVSGRGHLRFGDFEFDLLSGKLFRGGRPVKIQPQPLRVLAVLLERAGETVSRESLRARVWGDATFVEFDQGLNYCIRQIRVALRDGASEPVYIETLPKQGYRFIAPIEISTEVPRLDGADHTTSEPSVPNGIVVPATDGRTCAPPANPTSFRVAPGVGGFRCPGHRRRGRVFFAWPPAGWREVHPINRFYRFRPCTGAVA